jgi:lipoprotein-releasing system ATP-binding protein
MKSMAKKLNQTFIVVTHEPKYFGNVDKIITIKDGRIFEEEQPSELEVIA